MAFLFIICFQPEGSTSISRDVFLPINSIKFSIELFLKAGFSQIIILNEVFNVRYV